MAQYTSKSIQDEIISIIGTWFQKKILPNIHAGSKMFSLIADESRDCSNKEQMPVIVRYVNDISKIQNTF